MRFLNMNNISMITIGKDARMRIYFRDYVHEVSMTEKEAILDVLAMLVNDNDSAWFCIGNKVETN